MLNLSVGVQERNPFSFSFLDFHSHTFSCDTQFPWSFPLALLSFFSACLDLLDRAQRSIPIAVLSCLLIKYSNSELTESNYFFELGYRAVIKLGTERLLRTSALLLLSSWARDRLNQGVHSCVHSSDVLLPPRFRPAPSVARAFP